jgi:hypothetical protein
MGVRNQNSTSYVHPDEPNLLNLHKALEYDDAGKPHVRVSLGSDNITITGDVNLVDTVSVNSTPEDPVHTHITEVGTSGILAVPYMPIQGTVSIGSDGTVSLSATTLSALENITVGGTVELGTTTLAALENVGVTGTVTVQDGGGSITVDGSVTATISGTPTVNIGTIPEVEIKNDSGNPIPVEWIYGNGASLIPWQVQVARGLIPGVTGLSISGYNVDVGTSFVPIWHGTVYTYLTTATQLTVWSDSASDTNVSVLISGLNAAYVPITETVVLTNGATGVLTTSSFLRVNNMSLTRVPMNAGVIHAGNNGKSTVLCTIEIGAGRSQQTVYTVPAGYTFYLTQVNYYTNNTGNNTGLFRSWTQSPTGLINVVLTFPFPENYNSTKVVPRSYTEKTDIQWQVANKTGSSAIGGQIEGYLIQNGI